MCNDKLVSKGTFATYIKRSGKPQDLQAADPASHRICQPQFLQSTRFASRVPAIHRICKPRILQTTRFASRSSGKSVTQ